MQTANQNILQTILDEKRLEIAAAKDRAPLTDLKAKAQSLSAPRAFGERLKRASAPAIIAEIKRASPSKGVIRADLNPVETAAAYVAAGAACLSVLTDEKFFQGKLGYLAAIRAVLPEIPLLRKDFTCDTYQVWETRAAGADALLLIVAALDEVALAELLEESLTAGLGVLIEVHTTAELEIALQVINEVIPRNASAAYPLLGINNRDLKTFVTKLSVTEEILAFGRSISTRFKVGLDSLLIVAESGIKTGADIKQLSGYGAGAFLIGESLLAAGDPGENLWRLIADSRDK